MAAFMQGWMRGRGGSVLDSPSWTIDTEDDQVIARWSGLQSPELLEASAPKLGDGWDVYSCLFLAHTAQIMFNGHLVEGEPYTVDIWKPSLGGERSSCVFALSETFIEAAGRDG